MTESFYTLKREYLEHLKSRSDETINALRHQIDKEELDAQVNALKEEGYKQKKEFMDLSTRFERYDNLSQVSQVQWRSDKFKSV